MGRPASGAGPRGRHTTHATIGNHTDVPPRPHRVPLPAGRVRVAKMDLADRSLEFIGEDVIDHLPRDETVQIRLGSSFDVVGERKQLDFRIDTNA